METNSYLLDTSVIIDFLRKENKEQTLLYKIAKDNSNLYISLITHTEIYAGKSVWENEDAHQELETIFKGTEILEVNKEISKSAGKIRAQSGVDLIDAIIAATAEQYNLPLVTLNIKHFDQIKDLQVKKIK